MNGKVLLLVLLFVGWLFAGASWWNCPIWENCDDEVVEEMVDDTSTPEVNAPKIGMNLPTGPLTFSWSDLNPQTSGLFPAFRDSLVGLLKDNQKFEIVGNYFANEKTPTGFENMGLARATKIRDLFLQTGMDSSRFRLKSSLNEQDYDSISGNFVASVFNYKISSATIVEGEGKDFTIFFPFGSNQMNSDPAFGLKLDEAAAYLKSSGRHVVLTGHTDAKGDPERNKVLGLNRANGIRQELMQRGVAISQIDTRSEGENELMLPNQPDADQNRRVEVHFPN
ncbi:MAG: OmpA family protein [Bacteroidota bacterium]